MSRTTGVISKIIRILLVFGIALFAANCFNNNETTETTKETTATTKTNNDKEQTIRVDGLNITVPSGWQTEVDDAYGDMYIYPDDGGTIEVTTTQGYEADSQLTLTQLYESYVDGLEGDGDIFVEDNPQVFGIGDAVVFRTELNGAFTDGNYTGVMEFIASGSSVRSVIFIVPQEDYSSRSSEILSILDGISLDETETPILEIGS